jgi:hypothetical protein
MQNRFLLIRRSAILLNILWSLAVVLLGISYAVHLQKIGSLALFWTRSPINDIQPETGFAYIAPTHRPELSSHEHPSLAQVLENGKPLAGPANAVHDDIRQIGEGRYSFWHDYVDFSSSDNSDPRTNGRKYEIRAPAPIRRRVAYPIYGMTVVILGLAGFLSITRNWRAIVHFLGTLGNGLKQGIFAIPKVIGFLRSNRITSYLIPMPIWIVLVLVGMELILHVTVYSRPLFYRQTNWFGSIPEEASSYLWGEEGYAITQFDGPAREIHTPFQDGALHVIVLGDSFTEGLQVPDDQKYASVAEITLRQDGYVIDVHNLGNSGASMADYVSLMNAYQQLYHPGIIVVQLEPDDFIESFYQGRTNYFIAENSKIVDLVQQNALTGDYMILSKHNLASPLLMLQEYGIQRSGQWEAQGKAQANVSNANTAPETFNIDLAKQQMDLLIEASNGIPIILVPFPHAPYISGDQIIMDDPKQESLKEFLSSYSPQITLADPLPEFQELVSSGNYLPMGFFNSTTPGRGHLNRQGNDILGKLLAKTIEEVLK